MEYDQAARRRLGAAVREARVLAGYRKQDDFGAALEPSRSGRQVAALERGETGVGPDTWAAAARALGWPLDRVYELLEGRDARPTPSSLTQVSDEELAHEVLRRMQRAGDGDVHRDAASIAAVTDLTDRRPAAVELEEEAARDVGREGSLARRRREQDQASQPSRDDPTDMEPR